MDNAGSTFVLSCLLGATLWAGLVMFLILLDALTRGPGDR